MRLRSRMLFGAAGALGDTPQTLRIIGRGCMCLVWCLPGSIRIFGGPLGRVGEAQDWHPKRAKCESRGHAGRPGSFLCCSPGPFSSESVHRRISRNCEQIGQELHFEGNDLSHWGLRNFAGRVLITRARWLSKKLLVLFGGPFQH